MSRAVDRRQILSWLRTRQARFLRLIELVALLARQVAENVSPREGLPRCIKCERPIRPAAWGSAQTFEGAAWEMPAGAVLFKGGENIGSSLYDAALMQEDGCRVYAEVLVCDGCLKPALGSKLAREIRKKDDGARPAGSCGNA